MTLRVQLALQGGGAKVCLLVAVLEAVEALEAAGTIKVTRIAGTSAGAIAGTLYAAGVGMKVVKEKFKSLSADALSRLFPRPSAVGISISMLRGRPLWKTKRLEEILEGLLKPTGDYSTLDEVGQKKNIKLHVVATDLSESSKRVYTGNARTMTALLDSSALPYCFRTWTTSGNSVVVDGGICENLPSEELEPYVKDDGPVIGVSFARDGRRGVGNALDFSAALLEAAMNNSMDRARLRLGADFTLNIPTQITTFDFGRALGEGLGAEYDLAKERTERFFRELVDSQRKKNSLVGDPWATQPIDLMEKMAKVYEAQHSGRKCSYLRCSIVIKACSLLEKGEEGYGLPDEVKYWTEFKVLEDTVYCLMVSVSSTKHASSLERTSWQILDAEKNQIIDTIDIPIRIPGHPDERPMLLFFRPVLPPRSGPYQLSLHDMVQDAMKPLREDGRDNMGWTTKHAHGNVGRVDLVLWVPDRYTKARMVANEDSPLGRVMSLAELGQSSYLAPPGYRAIGWTGTDLDATKPFVADVLC